jgi:hypothetical protein
MSEDDGCAIFGGDGRIARRQLAICLVSTVFGFLFLSFHALSKTFCHPFFLGRQEVEVHFCHFET